MKKNIFRNAVILSIALVVSLGLGATAFAGTGSYSKQLPGMQGNVDLTSGTKSSWASSAYVYPSGIDAGSAWVWLDHNGVRASDSRLTYPNSSTPLGYYDATPRQGVVLRACTDGWQPAGYMTGTVDFS